MSSAVPLRGRAMEALWPVEAAAFVTLRPLLNWIGRGDEHPVIVLPGFGADDWSTLPLRWAIRGQGYWVHAWRLGPNVGPTASVASGLRARLQAVHAEHERTISLIGWSLGGILARALARESPDKVRQVITLGSPYRRLDTHRSRALHLRAPQAAYDRIRARHVPDFEIMQVAEHERPPLTVPATSIYSRDDTFAPWQQCIDDTSLEGPNPRSENIEVRTSHLGLGSNLPVLAVVLDRLAQPEGGWKPFRPLPPARWMYPTPATWIDRSRVPSRNAR
jgi:pimeloyl-ACP methyl ester carboxylesterase